MRSYMAVDESRLSGHRKLRRVLSAYMKRLGRRAWHGRLSNEGLAEMASELRRAATRSARASVYEADTGEAVISIGKGGRMDEEHGYARRMRKGKKRRSVDEADITDETEAMHKHSPKQTPKTKSK